MHGFAGSLLHHLPFSINCCFLLYFKCHLVHDESQSFDGQMQSNESLGKVWMKKTQRVICGVRNMAWELKDWQIPEWRSHSCCVVDAALFWIWFCLKNIRICQVVDIIFVVRFFLFLLHSSLFQSYCHQHVCKHNGIQNSIFISCWCQVLHLQIFYYFSSKGKGRQMEQR